MNSTFLVLFLIVTCTSTVVSLIFLYLTSQHNYVTVVPANQDRDFPAKISTSTNQSRPINVTSKPRHPLILYWGLPWGAAGYTPADGTMIDDCYVTNDRQKLSQSDIVVFHYTVINKRLIPWKLYRTADQVFVWWSAENPAILKHAGVDLSLYDGGFFNWTWTYRLDADVYRGYGYRGKVIDAVAKGTKAIDDVIKKKRKLAVWFVSKCGATRGAQKRLEYSQKLVEAGLDLERIGKCFNNQHLMPKGSKNFRETLRQYKFYMAFENSINCTDYVTEKFWFNALKNDAVPVVWGTPKRDLLRVAPPDSFIHVEDFSTPDLLAKYLNFLNRNQTEYRKYFRWREDESITDEKMISMIKEKYPDVKPLERPPSICEKFLANRGRKSIESLNKEFILSNPKECYELATNHKGA
uniref:Fucosyltransferase n=1 Tax=Phallusia mammillata TaxID=59560 RepID=A0A6F9DDW0_9ASCI|nr:alpha-(1,3)-fucosyltransferase 6 [Phallusia mammillata]